ncbi:MAG TPA: glycosyltransferase family 39 protein [Verrucomicrobiae bacterium]|nr:glycosyltransferase family 39 protein [Verrucomicrobiae bacterium]
MTQAAGLQERWKAPVRLRGRNTPAFLLGITAVAALALRVLNLGKQSLWIDEIFSVIAARMDASVLVRHLDMDVHPPFYFLLLKGWMALGLPQSEGGLRLLSAVLGTAVCLLAYAFGRQLFNRRAGLAAAVILAFSAYHVRYSQELRSYELVTLLALASFYFFERLNRAPDWKNGLGYAAASFLLLYTHTFGVLVLLAQNAFYFLSLGFARRWTRQPALVWLALQGLLLICYLPWLTTMLSQAGGMHNDGWVERPSVTALAAVLKYYAGSLPLLLLAAAVMAAVLFSSFRRGAPEAGFRVSFTRSAVMMLLWLMTGLLVPFVVSVLWSPVFVARLMIAASLPFYFLAAAAFSSLRSKAGRAFIAAAFLFLACAALASYYHTEKKEEWREAAAFVDGRAASNDLLLFHSDFTRLGYSYYTARPDLVLEGFPAPQGGEPSAEDHEIRDVLAGKARIWEIISHERSPLRDSDLRGLDAAVSGRPSLWLLESYSKDPEQRILRRLRKTYRETLHQSFRGIEVYRFEAAGRGEAPA